MGPVALALAGVTMFALIAWHVVRTFALTRRLADLCVTIGKLSVPPAILAKPGSLTAAEMDVVRRVAGGSTIAGSPVTVPRAA